VALRDRGFPIEYLLATDEGHGVQRQINNMATYAAMEKFLGSHLGGRYQERMTPEVRAQLKALTIDPKTVEKPKPITAAAGAPKPTASLEPGTAAYQMRI